MSTSFRRHLARRLLQIAALASPAVASPLMGCSNGACDPHISDPRTVCIDPTASSDLFDAGVGPIDSDGGASMVTCPSGDKAVSAIAQSPSASGWDFTIESGPTQQGATCCYVIQDICVAEGRPFLVDDQPITAPARRGASGWSDTEAPLPRVDDLPADVRAALAEAWARDGLFEHASVASFGRFALELLAAGAPADLVERAHMAALDEVRHARLCLGLASAYAGAPVGPGAFPFAGHVEVTDDLASIAARAAREGCVGETIAAAQAAEQLARATDPSIRAALAIIAEDEAQHAELAWRAVVWAVRAGGEPVRAAVAAVFASLACSDQAAPLREGPLDRHGRLDPEEQQRLAARVIAEVVRPAARMLLTGLFGGGDLGAPLIVD